MSPAWSLESGGGGATPPTPPVLPPSIGEGLILWLRGDAALTSIAGESTGWGDQSGYGQDVGNLPAQPGPQTGLDTIDGIPCVTCAPIVGANRGLYRSAGLLDRNGNPFGYAGGKTEPRTIMAMLLPRYSTEGSFPEFHFITGGIVAEMGSTPTFQPIFDLESTTFPDAFYTFSTGWKNTGFPGALRAPDVAGGSGGIYDNVPTLAAWTSSGFDNIGFAVNNVVKTLQPPAVIEGVPALGASSFAILRAISGGLSFFGAMSEMLIWDFDLNTDPAAYTQAVAYMVSRYPSAPIVI